jgi:ABC-2 type transport system permease protein
MSTLTTEHSDIRPGLWRATWAVAQRHVRIVLRYPGWYIALLIWPVLMPFSLVYGAKALAGPQGEGMATFTRMAGTPDYMGFIVVGTIFWMWFNSVLWGLGMAFRTEQLRGTLESNWLAPVPKVFLALGAFLGDAAIGLIVMTFATLSTTLVYRLPLTVNPPLLAAIVLLSVPSVYGIGLGFASLVLSAKEVNSAVFFVRGLMTVFCGVSFPIAALPDFMQPVSRLLPLTHSIGAVRAALAGASLGDVMPHLRYLVASGVLLLAGGFAIFALVQRRMLAAGTLGQY